MTVSKPIRTYYGVTIDFTKVEYTSADDVDVSGIERSKVWQEQRIEFGSDIPVTDIIKILVKHKDKEYAHVDFTDDAYDDTDYGNGLAIKYIADESDDIFENRKKKTARTIYNNWKTFREAKPAAVVKREKKIRQIEQLAKELNLDVDLKDKNV